jgi:hypothetical protein
MNARPGFLRAVAASFTWRALLVAQLLGFAFALLWLLGVGAEAPAPRVIAQFLDAALNAMLFLLAALCAEEWSRRGASGRRGYAVAFVVALVASALLQWWLRGWLGRLASPHALPPAEAQALTMLTYAFDFGIFGGIALLAYANRRAASRILERVRLMELRRVQQDRELVESRLAEAESQVDPQTLFAELGRIRSDYDAALPSAEERLDELIRRLRAALARTASAGHPAPERP